MHCGGAGSGDQGAIMRGKGYRWPRAQGHVRAFAPSRCPISVSVLLLPSPLSMPPRLHSSRALDTDLLRVKRQTRTARMCARNRLAHVCTVGARHQFGREHRLHVMRDVVYKRLSESRNHSRTQAERTLSLQTVENLNLNRSSPDYEAASQNRSIQLHLSREGSAAAFGLAYLAVISGALARAPGSGFYLLSWLQ